MQYEIGEKVLLKKQHPCGNSIFTIVRVGMDFKIKCDKCDYLIMLPRTKF